ncbi:MAG: hypothetical protein ABIZ49_02675 [Opitutaceae bacterium]
MLLSSLRPAVRVTRVRLFRGLSVLALLSVLSGALFAQADPNAPADANANGRGRRGQNGAGAADAGSRRANFDPAQMQQQMMERLRDRFGVTDDAEWKAISDRITAVTELQRTAGGGRGGAFAALGGGGRGGQGGGRGLRGGGSPEQDALNQAITDKLPDAEIKSRLARLRDARKANEEKVTKAQEDLRAVLDVRQEAVAVVMGLLP